MLLQKFIQIGFPPWSFNPIFILFLVQNTLFIKNKRTKNDEDFKHVDTLYACNLTVQINILNYHIHSPSESTCLLT